MDTATRVLLWEFQRPGRLWAILAAPVLAIVYVLILQLARRRGIRYTNTGLVAAVMPHQNQWKRHLSVAMALCSLVMIGGAWAKPVAVVNVPRERATIVLVMDVSRSMTATDVSPTRLDAAKKSATQFVSSLPAQYNVSLVVLSGHPSILVPPTVDRGVLNQAISKLQVADGTAIGQSLTEGLDAIAQAPKGEDGKPAPGVMVLLSDGGETSGGDPLGVAQQANDKGVPISTIAFGTQNGYVDLDGKRYNVAPDTALLAKIAQTSGGRAMTADSAGQLDNVYKDLRSDVGYEKERTEVTAQWALYSMAFAVIASLGVVSMAARWP
ncbi:VWA domain-containing protein [Propionibacterium sp.]|uniref:VWA domain-containing protein n=1 Tax=Propionibacterium sp. TaxID=1977903 RepID=UPI0039ECD974